MSDGRCKMEDVIESSECCRIPKTNRKFWVAKIRRNMERDKEEQRKLAAMGWHCITIWECELKPKLRERTLDSLAFTLNHIWLEDHRAPEGGQFKRLAVSEPLELRNYWNFRTLRTFFFRNSWEYGINTLLLHL